MRVTRRESSSGRSTRALAAALATATLLAACGTVSRGGYYQHDGPPDRVPDGLNTRDEPLPQVEPIRAATSRPYAVLGHSYTPMTTLAPYRERGLASWYGKQFHGQKTASGEPYDMFAMTAAHKTLPIPSYARVTNLRNGRSVIVRINDRGPFHDGRIVDLSYAAAVKLAGPNVGTQEVEVELLLPDEIARLRREPALARRDPAVVTVADAPPTTAMPPTVRADAPLADGPVVQLGAFAQREHAQALRERIVQARPDLAARCDIVLRDNLFRLQVGPYLDGIDAQTQALELTAQFGADAIVVDRR